MWAPAIVFHGIASCVTHFNVPNHRKHSHHYKNIAWVEVSYTVIEPIYNEMVALKKIHSFNISHIICNNSANISPIQIFCNKFNFLNFSLTTNDCQHEKKQQNQFNGKP